MKPHFTLSKSKLLDQVKTLEDLNLKISYSYKTNRDIGKVLQEIAPQVDFSIHALEEIGDIKDKSKISFFSPLDQDPCMPCPYLTISGFYRITPNLFFFCHYIFVTCCYQQVRQIKQITDFT